MIDTTALTALITAFRAETSKDSISPEKVGNILQQISDLLATAPTTSEIQILYTLRDTLKSVATMFTALAQGTADRNHIYLTPTTYNVVAGESTVQSDTVKIQQATTERAGAMRAQHVDDLYTAKKNITALQTECSSIRTDMTTGNSSLVKMINNLASDLQGKITSLQNSCVSLQNSITALQNKDTELQRDFNASIGTLTKSINSVATDAQNEITTLRTEITPIINGKFVYASPDNLNMDRCLQSGLYMYGCLADSVPDNHWNEYYIFYVDARYNAAEKMYYIIQTAYSVNYPCRAFMRIIETTDVTNTNGTYGEWYPILNNPQTT